MSAETQTYTAGVSELFGSYFAWGEYVDVALMGAGFRTEIESPKFDTVVKLNQAQGMLARATIDISVFNGSEPLNGVLYNQYDAGMILSVRTGEYFRDNHPEIKTSDIPLYIQDAVIGIGKGEIYDLDVELVDVVSRSYGELADAARRRAHRIKISASSL